MCEIELINCEDLLKQIDDYSKPEVPIDACLNIAFERCRKVQSSIQLYLETYKNFQYTNWNTLANSNLKFPNNVIEIIMKQLVQFANDFRLKFNSNLEVGIAKMNFHKMKTDIIPYPDQWKKKIEGILSPFLKSQIQTFKGWVCRNIDYISGEYDSLDDFIERVRINKSIRDFIIPNQEKAETTLEMLKTLRDFQLKIVKDESEKDIRLLFKTLTKMLNSSEDKAERKKDGYKNELSKLIIEINENSLKLLEESKNKKFLEIESGVESMQLTVSMMDEELKKLKVKADRCLNAQNTLDLGVIVFQHLEDAEIIIGMIVNLWKSLKIWQEKVSRWGEIKFALVDRDEIGPEADKFWKIVLRCEEYLGASSTAVQELKKQVDTFRQAMPVVLSLKNDDLSEYHWNEIKRLLKVKFDMENREFSLNELIELKVGKYKDDIELISNTATQEKILLRKLKEIKIEWEEKRNLKIIPYKDIKDAFILSDIDILLTDLEDALTSINNIIASRYIKRFLEQAMNQKHFLDLLLDTLEEWVLCQRNWIYLERLFSPKDMRNSLVKESKEFEAIDKKWKEIMKYAEKNPTVSIHINKKQVAHTFKELNKKMDVLFKRLEEFLEKKRQDFNRFYFLSNDELLQVLAHPQELEFVKHFLPKIFDNITNVYYSPEFPIFDIYAIESSELETVKLNNKITLKSDGSISWIKLLENYMIVSLKTYFRRAHRDTNIYDERKKWIFSHMAQSICVISQVLWTDSCEESIMNMNEDQDSLKELYLGSMNQLKELIQTIKENITPLQRKIIISLITTEVHGRDIIEQLTMDYVSSKNDFKWLKNLRYYAEEEGDSVLQEIVKVVQINHEER